MAVYLDDEPVDLGGRRLDEVLVAASRHLEDSGRIVVEVTLDGAALHGEDLEAGKDREVTGRELRLYSANPRDLARTTLEMLLAALDEAGRQQTEAAALIQRDQSAAAMVPLGRVLETWQQVRQAVPQAAALVGVDLALVAGGGAAAVEELVDKLRAMRDAIGARDAVRLADALAYEWPGTVDRWRQIVGGLIERIDAQA